MEKSNEKQNKPYSGFETGNMDKIGSNEKSKECPSCGKTNYTLPHLCGAYYKPSVEVSKCCGAVKKECRGHWCSDTDCCELTCSNCGLKFEPSVSDIPENTEIRENKEQLKEVVKKFINKYAGTGEWLIPKSARANLFSKIDLLLKQQKDGIVKEIEKADTILFTSKVCRDKIITIINNNHLSL